ncbi:Crp/Fnr family transcriptional regulator [Ideonella sp. BN130291]|uniref:Crp/Fnr family transcriptional regulator n=1 Tax=Ideonella sp. BN130291 TaxID=3112940 RepID=UPI002E26B5FB|nr:Crp/Fnr family transcriptional regulator [Ideonella sp. BN130291]
MPARPPSPRIEDLPGMSDALKALAQRGEVRHYRKGTVLMQEGDEGGTLLIILSGRVRVYSANGEGRELTHGTYGPGEYIGEMSLDGGPRSASVVTLEACSCAFVTRVLLHRFIGEHPEFAFELLTKVIWRARAATLSAKQLALSDVYERLVALLGRMAQDTPDGQRTLDPLPTHQALANELGCSREMVSRLLKDLVRGGYFELSAHKLKFMRRVPDRW